MAQITRARARERQPHTPRSKSPGQRRTAVDVQRPAQQQQQQQPQHRSNNCSRSRSNNHRDRDPTMNGNGGGGHENDDDQHMDGVGGIDDDEDPDFRVESPPSSHDEAPHGGGRRMAALMAAEAGGTASGHKKRKLEPQGSSPTSGGGARPDRDGRRHNPSRGDGPAWSAQAAADAAAPGPPPPPVKPGHRHRRGRRGARLDDGGGPLEVLCGMLLQGAPEGDSGRPPAFEVDVRKARNVLEAAAGDLVLASTFYWDDHFASASRDDPQQQKHLQQQQHHRDGGPSRENGARAAWAAQRPSAADDDNDEEDDQKPAAQGAGHQGGGVHNRRRDRRRREGSNPEEAIDLEDTGSEEEDSSSDGYGDDDGRPLLGGRNDGGAAAADAALDRLLQHAHARRLLGRGRGGDFQEEVASAGGGGRRRPPGADGNGQVDVDHHGGGREDGAVPPADAGGARHGRGGPLEMGGVDHDQDDDEDDDEDDDDDDDGIDVDEEALRLEQRAPQRVVAQAGEAESISVSDDENGTGGRLSQGGDGGSRRSSLEGRIDHAGGGIGIGGTSRRSVAQRSLEAAVAGDSTEARHGLIRSPESGRKRKRGDSDGRPGGGGDGDGGNDDDSDDDDYISDSDWLHDDGVSPTESLWGAGDPAAAASTSTAAAAAAAAAARADENAEGNNVVADDDEVEDVPKASQPGIPHTWLSAGFQLSDDGTGLVVVSPTVDDVEFFSWRQQQDAALRNSVPPPYHCKSVTAVLSVVTALLYTGASIQGRSVNCTSGKAPWAGLTPEERRREFDDRLADALSSLIFIAARASLERKTRAVRGVGQRRTADGSDATPPPSREEVLRDRKMLVRLRLIPTCVWEDDPSDFSRPPDGPLHYEAHVKTSLTNIDDIRLYVSSTMGSFTSHGGVALLLETIVRIHGNNVVARQLKKVRQREAQGGPPAPGQPSPQGDPAAPRRGVTSLIRCTCEERQRRLHEANPLPLNVRNNPNKLLDTTPEGTECLSVALATLLLTGRAQSSWKDCATKGLGFGILTDEVGEVGQAMARPERPVWVLRGGSCYSVLWLTKGGHDVDLKTVSKVDSPGATLQLTHWNCWYGQRNKSEFRLVAAADKEAPRKPSRLAKFDSQQNADGSSKPKIMTNLRRQHLIHLVSADEHESAVARERSSQIHPIELERITVHPEDQKLYPEQYRMWRFDVGDSDEDGERDDRKPRAESWVPYYRLTGRQKRAVAMKLGPKINQILWTRWPDATIDNFIPQDGTYPIV